MNDGTRTTPIPIDGLAVVDFEELSQLSRRSLLDILGVRRDDSLVAGVLSDLCFCEVTDPGQLLQALEWAEDRCGARIPLVVHRGPPPVRILITLRDLGPLASWYFRAIEAIHG